MVSKKGLFERLAQVLYLVLNVIAHCALHIGFRGKREWKKLALGCAKSGIGALENQVMSSSLTFFCFWLTHMESQPKWRGAGERGTFRVPKSTTQLKCMFQNENWV